MLGIEYKFENFLIIWIREVVWFRIINIRYWGKKGVDSIRIGGRGFVVKVKLIYMEKGYLRD